jgi:hypothetical protein
MEKKKERKEKKRKRKKERNMEKISNLKILREKNKRQFMKMEKVFF